MQLTYPNNYNRQSQCLRESSRISTNGYTPGTMNGYTPATVNGYTPATTNGCANWQSMLKLKVTNLSSVTRAKDLKDHFEAFGKLERVELDREVPGTAYIVYRPVPLNESFLYRPHIRDGHQIFITTMPHSPDRDPDRWGRWGHAGNRSKYTFKAISLELGVMLSPDTFVPEWRTRTSVELSLNFEAKTIHIHFVHNNRRYKMETNFKHIDDKVLVAEEPNIYTLTLPLKYPGRYWWLNPEARFVTDMEWYQKSQWHRVVNIPLNDDVPNRIDAPLTPHLTDKVVRIGRWTVHRLRFQCASTLERERFTQILREVAEYNILAYNHAAREFVPTPLHTIYPANLPLPINPASQLHGEDDFEILYMLESLILNNFINERNLNLPFYRLLTSLPTSCAVHALMSLAAPKRRIYDPFEQLKATVGTITIARSDVPPNFLMVRKVVITPTTLYVAAPVMETSNRVVRHYRRVQDRFLRVQFLDEGMGKVGLTAASESRVNDAVYDRIYDVQRKGIKIGNRVYKFLAFSNSQLREHACWFFAPEPSLSCFNIRKWMGNFSSIKVIAKNAARMGQCFSSTRAISKLEVQDVITIDDIENHGYTFSDGIGKISPRLAEDVAEKLQLKSVPSAFQFRLGGAKGVLAVWNVQGQVQLRPSQKKFESTHRELEIIKTSTLTSAYLNRQVITLLSARGVPDQTFLDMKSQRIRELDQMLKNPQAAIDTLMQNIDGYGTARFMADIVRAGFFVREDPFILNLIRLFRVTMLKDLKKRAKIHIPKGAYLFGVLDETRTLKENEVFVQLSDPANPEKVKCIEGECVVLRVPCFHPGDVRVVQAVKCDRLRHLKDVLVFSANGDRDLPNMCSGGDLDGDEYTQ
ncbi:RNA dependent RNA polymerase-domain-containing protein, partial [Jimgerdemannia flammicorona]